MVDVGDGEEESSGAVAYCVAGVVESGSSGEGVGVVGEIFGFGVVGC